jgi:hypothetical protein
MRCVVVGRGLRMADLPSLVDDDRSDRS